jgi:hypothetical protein
MSQFVISSLIDLLENPPLSPVETEAPAATPTPAP